MEDVEVRGSCTTALVNQFTKDSHQEVEEDFKALLMTEQCVPENRFINIALLYLYRKGSDEVKEFCNKNKIKAVAGEVEGSCRARADCWKE